MNFEKIFHGMIGKDFIKAFNDNFTIADKTFLDILAVLIYKVKSTDIKEFKVIDNVVSYTLEDAPEEGEDNRVWTPVDITKWSNITGNIEDQEDLWNILENKAALDTVQEISNLLNTLNSDFSQLKDKVETNEATLRVNTNDIADLLEEMTEKVNSTNIKAIRLNNAVFQWSPDGRTWYEQPLTTSIAWGHLTGDITTQEDLMALFTNIQNQFTELDGIITTIKNLRNADKLKDAAMAFTTTFNAVKEAKVAVNGFKAVKTAKNIGATVSAIRAGSIAAAGTVVPGAGAIVGFLVWTAIDILLGELFDWLENRNVCVLLPLWWEGTVFISGVKNGKKILLCRDDVTRTDDEEEMANATDYIQENPSEDND